VHRWLSSALGTLLLASGAAAGEADPEGVSRTTVRALDLELMASTTVRLSPTHAATYATKLLELARPLFECAGSGQLGKDGATYRVLLEHTGTIDIGTLPFVRLAKGKVFRDGQFLGGEERRWFMPVRRDCMVRVSLMRRAGADYVAPVQFVVKEPPTPDEELYGGVEVASAARAAGDPKGACPLSREAACQKAIAAIEPPIARLQRELARRLLEVRNIRLLPPAGPSLTPPSQPTVLPAEISVENRTPWFLHRFRVRAPGKFPHGRTLYTVEADFSGILAPGKEKTVVGRATECTRGETPPSTEVTELRWSLKGQF